MAAGDGSGTRTSLAGSAVSHTDGSGEVPDRREQILQAAQRLFAVQGFRETNLSDVAAQLGFRRQAFYHYFRSKDEILYELIDRAGRAVTTSAQLTMDADLAPADMLAEIVRSHVRQLLTNVDIFRIQFSELSKLTGARADMLRRDIAAYVHRIANVIEAGQQDGTFADGPPMVHALLIMGMCNGTTEWYGGTRTRLSIDQIADYAARLALAGVLTAVRPGH